MPTSTLPEQFGRYRILGKLGEGGMGAVYLAQDTLLGRQVALKVPSFGAEVAPQLVERFYREARAAAGIHHPNVCPVHDVGQVDGVHFLTMPVIEGSPLSRLLDPDRPWEPRQAVDLVRRLALALSALHQKGLLHRDLKPANVMIGPEGEPVLMDFGLARSFTEQEPRLTRTGKTVGTPSYMAPEQVAGARGRMGPASDLYSLGVILYELLAGRLPFDGSLDEMFSRILHEAPEPPSALRPDLDPGLDALCLKALAKKPQDRYASMAEFAQALQDWLRTGEPAAAPPGTPPLPVERAAAAARPTRLVCPKCGKRLRVPVAAAGKRWKCPACGTRLGGAGGDRVGEVAPESANNTREVVPPLLTAVSLPLPGDSPSDPLSASEGEPPLATPPPAEARPPARGRAALELTLPEEVTVQPGQRQTVVVRVKRQRCGGPVELRLERLPAGVEQAGPAFISADADEGKVEVTAAPGADRVSARVRLRAIAAGVRAKGRFLLTVEPPPLAREVVNSIGMKLVLIPAGKSLMGSPPTEKGRSDDEGQREVEITRPFYLGVYPVTQAEYEKVMGSNPSWFSPTGKGQAAVKDLDTSRFPVDSVPWSRAREFCARLSALPSERAAGRVYRLPTEAEWEYACRSGGRSARPFHCGDSLSSGQANCDGNYPYGGAASGPYLARTTRVGSYEANALGLYDMHGNVWEWCADRYGPDDATRKEAPQGPDGAGSRIVRGGSWDVGGGGCRAACRGRYEPDVRDREVGFRVVLVTGPKLP